MNKNYNLQAEQSVIGGLLVQPEYFDDVIELVAEKEFYCAEHQLVFRHITKLAEQNKQIDVITVAESLQKTGKLDKLGGLAFLGNLAHNVPVTANIKSYAAIVRKQYKEREFLAVVSDLNSIAESHGETTEKIENSINLLNGLADDNREGIVSITDAVQNAMESLEHRFANGGDIHGLKTGFNDFDQKCGGLHPGDLIILAGRPAMGKTAFATNIAENVALSGESVLMFSLEMSTEQLANRVIASVGSINLNSLRSAKLQDDDWGKLTYAMGKINESPLLIDQNPMITASQMHSRARKLKRKKGLSLIVIDYLQLMTEGGDTRNNELSTITRKLKLMAKDLAVPVICLSQLSRKVEERADKRPMMSDLRDSGAIEQDADMIVMMYRDDYYNPDSQNKGIAEAIIAKQRMGETGKVLLTFQGEYSRFRDFAGTYHQTTNKPARRGFDNKSRASGNEQ